MAPIYASTACVPGTVDLEQRLADYRRAGIWNVELGAGVVPSAEGWARWRSEGHTFLIHNYFPPPPTSFVLNLASPDDATRARSVAHVVSAVGLSARLGAPFYSVHGGFIVDPVGFGDTSFRFPAATPQQTSAAVRLFDESLGAVTGAAREAGVRIAVENNVCTAELRGKLLLQSAEEFVAMLREWRREGVGVLLDTGHLNVTAHTFGFDRLRFVEAIHDDVIAFHLHDNGGDADSHHPVSRDSWVMPILRDPRSAEIPIVVEAKFDSVAALRRHLDWLAAELGRGEAAGR